ncbi:hypothetical protein D3C86_898640 [compost metagenome]|jgi:hypothetical protein
MPKLHVTRGEGRAIAVRGHTVEESLPGRHGNVLFRYFIAAALKWKRNGLRSSILGAENQPVLVLAKNQTLR